VLSYALNQKWRCVMLKFLHLLVSAMVIGVPAAGLAQFNDKGDHVEVKKGTRLCSSIPVDGVRGTLNQRPIFWKVTSPIRANGTQAVSVGATCRMAVRSARRQVLERRRSCQAKFRAWK